LQCLSALAGFLPIVSNGKIKHADEEDGFALEEMPLSFHDSSHNQV
jgi:hypothetical protein